MGAIRLAKRAGACVIAALWAISASAQSQEEDLAKQLANPVAALISIPLQFNLDERIGPDDDGRRLTFNLQPVVPFDLNNDWNLISRTIVPLIWTDDIPSGADEDFGVGDTLQSFFFSPKRPTANGWIWGAGPALLLPTSSDTQFGAGEWGFGPTAVALRQQGPWSYGGLANHIWDINGDVEINQTFLQPFVSYTTPDAWTFTLATESIYDWENEQWAVPINAVVSKVTSIGGQLVSIGGAVRYWAEAPDNGPEGWAARLQFTLLYPR